MSEPNLAAPAAGMMSSRSSGEGQREVEVDESKLQVVAAGVGGVLEMKQYLNDNELMWALMRFEYGQGAQARQKIVLLNFAGEKATKLQREQFKGLNQMATYVLRARGKGHFHASIEIRGLEDVTAEIVMSEMSESFIVSSASVAPQQKILADYQEQLAKEMAEANTAEKIEKRQKIRAERIARRKEIAAQIMDEMEEVVSIEKAVSNPRVDKVATEVSVAKARPSLTVGRRVSAAGRRQSTILTQLSIEGLTQVGKSGSWNWVLMGPDVTKLPFLGGGSGGVDEMRELALKNEDLVMYGLLRVQFSNGKHSQTRFAMMHIVGTETPVVKRGRWNAMRPAFEKLFGQYASITTVVADVASEDVTACTVLDKLDFAKDYLVQGAGTVTAAKQYQEALVKERATIRAGTIHGPIQKLRSKLLEEDAAALKAEEERPKAEEERKKAEHERPKAEEVRKTAEEERPEAEEERKKVEEQKKAEEKAEETKVAEPEAASEADESEDALSDVSDECDEVDDADEDSPLHYTNYQIDEATRLVRDGECNWALLRPDPKSPFVPLGRETLKTLETCPETTATSPRQSNSTR